MALSLDLSEEDLDAVWMWPAELDPGVARLCQVFGSHDCPDISLQLWRTLVPLPMSRVEALSAHGLIEVANDSRLPHHRRPVRASDRLVELANGEVRVDGELRELARLATVSSGPRGPTIADAVRTSEGLNFDRVGPEGFWRADFQAGAGVLTADVFRRDLTVDHHARWRRDRLVFAGGRSGSSWFLLRQDSPRISTR